MWKRVTHVAVIAVAFVTRVRADDLYRINLSPPDHVGQKFEYRATETEASQTRRERGKDFQIVANQSSTLDFLSKVQVEACDQRGMPSKLKLTVLSLRPPAVNALNIIDPGTELTARAIQVESEPPKYRDVFEEADGVCHPFQEASLRRVITIGGATESSEQQAFGTDKPLPIGGTWSLDGEPGVRLLAKLQIKTEPRHVKGTAQLAKITLREGIQCLEVHMTVSCDECQTHVPPGQTVDASTTHCDLTYFIAKETGRVVEATYHARTDLEVQVSEGNGFRTDRSASETERNIKISDPLKVARPFGEP